MSNKKKGRRGGDDYWESEEALADAALVAGETPPKPAAAPAATAKPEAPQAGGGKKKDKGKAAAKADDAESTAAPPADPQPAAAAAAVEAKPAAPPAPSDAAPAAEEGADDGSDGGEVEEEEESKGKPSAPKGKDAAKKKKKPEAKKAAGKGAAARAALAKRIQEEQAARRAEEEELKRLEEEARKREEEERRAEEEREKKASEERERQKIERKARAEIAKKEQDRKAAEQRKRDALSKYAGSVAAAAAVQASLDGAPATPAGDASAPAVAAPTAAAAAAVPGAAVEGGDKAEKGEAKQKRPIYEKKKSKKASAHNSNSNSNSTSASASATPLNGSATPSPGASAVATPLAQSEAEAAPPAAAAATAAAPAADTEPIDDWEAHDAPAKPTPPVAVAVAVAVATAPAAIAPAAAGATANGKGAAAAPDEKPSASAETKGSGGKKGGKAGKGESGKEEEKRKKEEDEELRSPICCVLGHVDVGKTKLLDKIRRTNYQDSEAGGITQQIGATYFPLETLKEKTRLLSEKWKLDIKVPGLLVIDTPGHESFTNLRSRGSSLCDIAVLVVDLMHGLEPQTLQSIELLKKKKCPFVVALNKVDRLYGWKAHPNSPVQASLKDQNKDAKAEFEQRVQEIVTQFAEQGLNAVLYYQNKDFKSWVSLVPTSAHTGEGIPDLLMLLVQLTQRMMRSQLVLSKELACTVLEVKVVEGHGTTIDVILYDGELREGDEIVVCGLNGPICTSIRALLTPPPLKELRFKNQYLHNKVCRAAQGIKIAAHDLEHAVAGSQLFVVRKPEDREVAKKEVMKDLDTITKLHSEKGAVGVYVQASTLGSLEALLEFLKDSGIPVSSVALGPVHKKDVIKASVMLERSPEHAVILAFDVRVTPEAEQQAANMGVKVFTADIIYHLFTKFNKYMEELRSQKKKEAVEAVFPCMLQVIPEYVFHVKEPIILGCRILDGTLRMGTPVCVPSKDFIELGRVTSLENNHKPVDVAKKGDSVAVRLEGANPLREYGRHFDHTNLLYTKISLDSLDALYANFKDEVTKEDELLLKEMKKVFKSQLHVI